MNPYEEQVREYLEEKGWSVVNLEPGLFLLNKFETKEKKGLAAELAHEVGMAKFRVGCPDLLAYKYVKEDGFKNKILDYKFVEVKAEEDSLRLNQFKWMAKYDYDIEVAIVDKESGIQFFKTNIMIGEYL